MTFFVQLLYIFYSLVFQFGIGIWWTFIQVIYGWTQQIFRQTKQN